MELKTLASEMKIQAEAMPMNIENIMKGFAGQSFPENLKRTEDIDGIGRVLVQYTHDHLSPGKFIKHLSFSTQDLKRPSIQIQNLFQEAFFGDSKDIISLPSALPYVVQIARLIVFDVQNN